MFVADQLSGVTFERKKLTFREGALVGKRCVDNGVGTAGNAVTRVFVVLLATVGASELLGHGDSPWFEACAVCKTNYIILIK